MSAPIGAEAVRRVSTLELFFDLVFVFTVTQLTVLIADDLTFATAGRVVLIFTVLFWMYGGYAYLTNQVPPDRPSRRILLILGMGAFLICALSIPRAFDDGDDSGGVAFGIGYLLVVLVHGALYSRSHGRRVVWFVLPNVLAALAVTAAGFAEGLARDVLWLLALVLQFATPPLVRRAARPGEDEGLGSRIGTMSPSHLVERHGLLLIVAFGESIIAIGIGIGELPLTFGLFAGAFLALALTAALWWTYFVRDEGIAERVFARTPPLQRFKLALNAYYYYSFLPMLIGIAFLAAGVKKSIGHPGEQLSAGPALALAGGVALFLAGDIAFRRVLGITPVVYRAVAVLGTPATALLGMWLSATAQLIGLVAVLVAMLSVEARWTGSPAAAAGTDDGTGT
ncbi:low temperature requirement protein A [Streptomyces sp. NPDC059909]|uniref:low temperature requirement protein A n=1 Tax=Streptomyces sp. NPDC059909 TaxID=3346998 RepID=UPI003660EE82